MKVLIINNNAMYEAGRGLHIYPKTGQFIVHLNKLGADVENFHFREKTAENSYMATFDVNKEGIRITAVKKHRIKFLAYINAYFTGIKRVFYNDFSYIFYPNSFSYLALISILLRRPYGLYVRGEKGIERWISRYLFSHASFVLTVSPAFTDKVRASGGNSETIRPMIDFSEQDIIRNRKYNDKEVYKILFLSRLEYAKGIMELIDAVNILINKGIRNIKLDIVGEGPDYQIIEDMVRELKLEEYVKLVGLVTSSEQIRKLYVDSDIFVCASHHEGFPRVLYEAMIFGLPIVTTMVGAISYLMKDNYNCLRIEPGDSKGLAGKISHIISNYPAIKVISNNATLTIDTYLTQNGETHSEQLFRKIMEEL